VILSINEDQQEEVVKTLWEYKFYGKYLLASINELFLTPA
jgi:hypothetical protein